MVMQPMMWYCPEKVAYDSENNFSYSHVRQVMSPLLKQFQPAPTTHKHFFDIISGHKEEERLWEWNCRFAKPTYFATRRAQIWNRLRNDKFNVWYSFKLFIRCGRVWVDSVYSERLQTILVYVVQCHAKKLFLKRLRIFKLSFLRF